MRFRTVTALQTSAGEVAVQVKIIEGMTACCSNIRSLGLRQEREEGDSTVPTDHPQEVSQAGYPVSKIWRGKFQLL